MSRFTPSPYGIAFVSAFVLGFGFVCLFLRKRAVPGRLLLYSASFNTCSILYFAKLYTCIAGGFEKSLWTAGFSSLGGAVGMLVGIIVFDLICPGYRRDFFTAYILAIPLMYSISKIGCHFAGCCHGIVYHGPLAVSYHNKLLSADGLFPVQLTESIVFFLIFLISLFFYKKLSHQRGLRTIAFTMLLCSIAKFSLEYLRAEHVGVILSMNQCVCIFFFLLSGFLFYKSGRI